MKPHGVAGYEHAPLPQDRNGRCPTRQPERIAYRENLAIISDGAGQFNVLAHGLCWGHGERLIYKMLPPHDQHRADIAKVRSQVWDLYADLKSRRPKH